MGVVLGMGSGLNALVTLWFALVTLNRVEGADGGVGWFRVGGSAR